MEKSNRESIKRGIILVLVLLVVLGTYRVLYYSVPKTAETDAFSDKMPIIQGNSLLPISPVIFPNTQVLASRIIDCESEGNPSVCNKEYGCKAGMGLFQLIPKTVKYCEDKLGRTIDPFNADDNMACGMWLLENEGTYHWGTAETDWGSYDCWNK